MASIRRNQINQAPFIAVIPMVYFKVSSLPQVNESASMNRMQTWYCLLLHHYESTILSKGYSLALTK